MTNSDYNNLLDSTLQIGVVVINSDFDSAGFLKYQINIKEIVEIGYRLCKERKQLKTCHILYNKKIEDYRLSFLGQIFNTYYRGYYGKVNSKNTDIQIKKRYVVDLNRYIPILVQK